MKSYWLYKGIKIAGFAALYILFFGTIVMSLWNWLMPNLFGLATIDFAQALGLLVLSRILTGGFRMGFGYADNPQDWEMRKKMYQKWSGMSPEERERWKQEWRDRCRTRRPIGYHKNQDSDKTDSGQI